MKLLVFICALCMLCIGAFALPTLPATLEAGETIGDSVFSTAPTFEASRMPTALDVADLVLGVPIVEARQALESPLIVSCGCAVHALYKYSIPTLRADLAYGLPLLA